MSYYVCNGMGESEDDPSVEVMRKFIEALDPDDEEHGAAWVGNDEEYSLEYSVGGNLCFSSPDGEPRHMTAVPTDRVLELWMKLARGQLDELERESWKPGACEPLPPEELARRQKELAEWQLWRDREFYDKLGAERQDEPCRSVNCGRGAISLSVFCRRHHFESIHRRPCPFQD